MYFCSKADILMTDWGVQGEVYWKERCKAPAPKKFGSGSVECGGYLGELWIEVTEPSVVIRRTECIVCHDRQFERICVASAGDEGEVVVGESDLPTLNCPRCRVNVKRVLSFKHEVLCEHCVREEKKHESS